MRVEEHVPLASLTTLKVGGEARYVVSCEDEADIAQALAFAHEHDLPFSVLGGGSNLLPSDAGYAGVLIRILFNELTITRKSDTATIVAGANVLWDDVVQAAAREDVWGIENLAGIPGTVGGAPIQNIGAYGTELSETLSYVETYDVQANAPRSLTNKECAFGYRDSIFKHEPNLIVLRIALELSSQGTPNIGYKDLALYAAEHPLATPAQVGEAVRSIRSRKFPDLRECGTAGSFFKNPIISSAAYEKLTARYPELPGFPTMEGVKVPLAWILDNILSLRGFSHERARLFERQPLVIVTDDGATATQVNELANLVAKKVFDATGITLEREVRSLSEK